MCIIRLPETNNINPENEFPFVSKPTVFRANRQFLGRVSVNTYVTVCIYIYVYTHDFIYSTDPGDYQVCSGFNPLKSRPSKKQTAGI